MIKVLTFWSMRLRTYYSLCARLISIVANNVYIYLHLICCILYFHFKCFANFTLYSHYHTCFSCLITRHVTLDSQHFCATISPALDDHTVRPRSRIVRSGGTLIRSYGHNPVKISTVFIIVKLTIVTITLTNKNKHK